MAAGQDREVRLTNDDGEMPRLTGKRLEYFRFACEWSKFGREWWELMQLSPAWRKRIRVEIAAMRTELREARLEATETGLLPPKADG